MKYFSAPFSTHNDLIAVIKSFLEKSGWTIARFGWMEPTERITTEYEIVNYVKVYKKVTDVDRRMGMQLIASKAGSNFSFRSVDGIDLENEKFLGRSLYGQRGVVVQALNSFDSSKRFIEQARRTSQKCLLESGQGGTVYFYASGDYVLITTKYAQNRYATVSFGNLPLYVPGTGGQYICSTQALDSTYVTPLFSDYAPMVSYKYNYQSLVGWDNGNITRSEMMVYSYPGNEFPTNSNPGMTYGNVGNFARCGKLAGGFPGLVPVRIYVLLGGKYSPFAEFSNVFFTSFEHVEPGQVFKIGQSRYVGFPFVGKQDQLSASSNIGYVVKLDD